MLLGICKSVTKVPNPNGYEQEALKFFTAISKQGASLSTDELTATNRLVQDLKGKPNPDYSTYNIWDKFNAIYPLVGSVWQSHMFNLVNPKNQDTAYRLTFYGAPSHDANGINFDGASNFALTGLLPNTGPDNFMAVYDRTPAAERISQRAYIGLGGGLTRTQLFHWQADTIYHCNGCFPGLASPMSTITPAGCVIGNRTNNTNAQTYQNGVLTADAALPFYGMSPQEYAIGGSGEGFKSARFLSPARIGFAAIGTGTGKSLTSNEIVFLNHAITAFMTQLSRDV